MMHSPAIRNDLVAKHPWLPKAVVYVYSESKTMGYSAMQEKGYFEDYAVFCFGTGKPRGGNG